MHKGNRGKDEQLSRAKKMFLNLQTLTSFEWIEFIILLDQRQFESGVCFTGHSFRPMAPLTLASYMPGHQAGPGIRAFAEAVADGVGFWALQKDFAQMVGIIK